MPDGKEASEHGLLGRLDLFSQCGERGAAQTPEHIGIAPLALDAARAQLAAHEPVGTLEAREQLRDTAWLEVVAFRCLSCRERAVRPSEAREQGRQGIGHRLEVGLRKPAG